MGDSLPNMERQSQPLFEWTELSDQWEIHFLFKSSEIFRVRYVSLGPDISPEVP